MIIKDLKTQKVTIFLEKGRELTMSDKEFAELEYLIKNPPPVVDVKPFKLWAPS
jgi:DNA-binding response OmpR family regulator